MAMVKFNMNEVQKLVDELNNTSYFPTIEDIFNPDLYKEGKVVDSNGVEEGHEDFIWPDSSQIDNSLVQPQLQLVKDQGLYLINNADVKGSPEARGAIVYAEGCNPHKDDDFYQNAKWIFGNDDGSEVIPLTWFNLAKKANNSLLTLNVSPLQTSIVL